MNVIRPYQTEALRRIFAAWDAGRRRVLAVGPPAAGKTELAARTIAWAHARDLRCLYLSHRIDHIDDVTGRLADLSVAVGKRVCVATVQSVLGSKLGHFDVCIVDEAHHYRSDEWKKVLDRLVAKALVVGFTATPQRSDGKPLGDVFQELIVVASYSELLQHDPPLMVPCRVMHPPHRLDGALAITAFEAYVRHGGGRPAIVYERGQAAVRATHREFVAAGIPSAVILSGTPREERAAALAAFKDGAIRVLINYDVLTEGTNLPPAEVIVLARGCQHAGAFLQITGRALRVHPGKESALLLDLVGATYRHGLPTTDRVYSLDGKLPIAFDGIDVEVLQALRERRDVTVTGCGLVEWSPDSASPRVVDWAAVGLGARADAVIARELGVSTWTVHAARKERGVPAFSQGVARAWRPRARNVGITFRGETLTLAQWARRIGITGTGLRRRINRTGVERALGG